MTDNKLTDAENSARKLIAILCAAGIGGVLPTIAKLAGNYVASSNPVLLPIPAKMITDSMSS